MTEQEAVSVRDYLEAVLDARLTSVMVRMDAIDRAVNKAEHAMDQRMALANEFRATLQDQAAGFVPRKEYAVQHSTLEDRLAKLENISHEQKGMGSAVTVLYFLLLAVGAGVGIWATVAAKVWNVH